MLTATLCSFKQYETSEWEPGIAITSEPGFSDVVVILPKWATSKADVISEVWKYKLHWHEGTTVLHDNFGDESRDALFLIDTA